MPDYSKMTNEDFDHILAERVGETPGCVLLTLPGVYEALSEHFNNEVLEEWALTHPELAYPESEDATMTQRDPLKPQGYRIVSHDGGTWSLFAHRPLESDDPEGWDEIEEGFDTAQEALAAALTLEKED